MASHHTHAKRDAWDAWDAWDEMSRTTRYAQILRYSTNVLMSFAAQHGILCCAISHLIAIADQRDNVTHC
jgi:hypothetical protein